MNAKTQYPLVVACGFSVGLLGGLVGLGGAEFRLPLLIGLFRFEALRAVILNKATSLVVVLAALVFRTRSISVASLWAQWPVVAVLLSGSLLGAWVGAGWATRLKSATLHRVLAGLLVAIAVALLFGHGDGHPGETSALGPARVGGGVAAGFGIGAVASLMGVAGGELLIPTIVLLFGIDVRLAGSLSLAVSLPTMLVGFARYSCDRSFEVLREERGFVAWLALGSFGGAMVGGLLVGAVPSRILLPVLALILLVSAVKTWRPE